MKKRELTCIVCPKGCELTVTLSEDGGIEKVEGYTCKRGLAYAEAECTAPTRTVTTTVALTDGGVLPVKTNAPIPKELMFEAMQVINKVVAPTTAVIGDVLIEDLLGTGVALVATANAKH